MIYWLNNYVFDDIWKYGSVFHLQIFISWMGAMVLINVHGGVNINQKNFL